MLRCVLINHGIIQDARLLLWGEKKKKKANVALGRLRERAPGRERTAQGNGEPFSCFTTSELRVNKDRGSNYASEKSPSFPRGDGEPVLVGEKESMAS